jgi:hypothetical protein
MLPLATSSQLLVENSPLVVGWLCCRWLVFCISRFSAVQLMLVSSFLHRDSRFFQALLAVKAIGSVREKVAGPPASFVIDLL